MIMNGSIPDELIKWWHYWEMAKSRRSLVGRSR
jgi:hypothetical protein